MRRSDGKKSEPDPRIKLFFRVHPDTRRQFKAVAGMLGETMEGRAEKLLREDIHKHLALLTEKALDPA